MEAGSDGNDVEFKVVVQDRMPLGYVKVIEAWGWVDYKGHYQIVWRSRCKRHKVGLESF